MAPPIASSPAGSGHGAADIFLHVQTKKAGKIKGEASSPGHIDDIIIHGWRWSVSASSALGSVQATGRRSYTALTVRKQIDRATTALMQALVTNDEVKEAKLTMRRASGEQDEYFTITLQAARVTAVEHVADAEGGTYENVSFTFTKVNAEYTPQKGTGLRSGSTSFSDELFQA